MLCYSDFRLSKYVLPCHEGRFGAGSLEMQVHVGTQIKKKEDDHFHEKIRKIRILVYGDLYARCHVSAFDGTSSCGGGTRGQMGHL